PTAVARKWCINNGIKNRLAISRDKSLKKAILPQIGPQVSFNKTLDNEYQPIPEETAKPCDIGSCNNNADKIPPHKELSVSKMEIAMPCLLKNTCRKLIPLLRS